MPAPEGDAAGSWAGLAAELDRWADTGREAEFWWRDDDAGGATPALARLLALTGGQGIAPLLAVVPDWAEPSLAEAFAGTAARVAQHGIAHRNNAPATARKTELVDGQPALDDALRAGFSELSALLGERLLPVLVPPWNRIGDGLRQRLAGLGYRGLSTYRPRTAAATDGLVLVNCHADPVDWHGGRGFVGAPAALNQVTAHLRARRRKEIDPDEPTGILSHHAAQDAATWRFLGDLATRLTAHRAVRWRTPADLFGER